MSDQKAIIAIERATSYEPSTVRAAVENVLSAFGGWESLIRPNDRVLVKPNSICSAEADRPVQTHPAMILEVCRSLLDYGAKPFVGDSPAWGSLRGNLRTLGALEGLEALGVEIVEFKNSVRAANPRGKVFNHLTVDRAALEADAIVNLPKLKAHRQLALTAAIKNMFGCVGGRRKAWWHVKAGNYENYFGRMLVDTFELLRPAITIIDAIVAMEGNGPVRGTPRAMNLVLGGVDGPALERVAAELVGLKPTKLRTLAAARELVIGTPFLDQIETMGMTIDEAKLADFDIPKLLPIGFSLPRLVKGTFKNAWIVREQNRCEASHSRSQSTGAA